MTEPIEGLRELDRALAELPKATSKNVARRVLKQAGQPVMDEFRRRAPRSDEAEQHLADSGGVSTKLSARQRRLQRRHGTDDVMMYVGPGPDPAAWTQEFGTINHPAQPSLTPSWESNKRKSLDIIKSNLWGEIKKSADRLAKKAKRLAAKGG